MKLFAISNIIVVGRLEVELMEGLMDYMTSAEIAKKWNISQRRVAVYCKEGRVKGAALKGRMWMIPSDAKKPEDPRREGRQASN